MPRSRKIFLAFALVFFLLLVYIVYDISSRTTFPGSDPPETGTVPADTLHEPSPPDSLP